MKHVSSEHVVFEMMIMATNAFFLFFFNDEARSSSIRNSCNSKSSVMVLGRRRLRLHKLHNLMAILLQFFCTHFARPAGFVLGLVNSKRARGPSLKRNCAQLRAAASFCTHHANPWKCNFVCSRPKSKSNIYCKKSTICSKKYWEDILKKALVWARWPSCLPTQGATRSEYQNNHKIGRFLIPKKFLEVNQVSEGFGRFEIWAFFTLGEAAFCCPEAWQCRCVPPRENSYTLQTPECNQYVSRKSLVWCGCGGAPFASAAIAFYAKDRLPSSNKAGGGC